MSLSEVIAFEKLDGHDRAVALRRWDDGAKVDGASTVSLATFRDLVESVASVPSS